MKQIKTLKIKDLVPFDRNPRKNDAAVDRVLESLKNNGYVAPIIVSEVGAPFQQHVVCVGHTRLKALKKFGAKEVDCIVHSFESEAQFIRYNIEDNKTSEFADWNEQLLADLSAEFDIDLDGMGFEDFQDVDKINSGDENSEWVGMPEFEEGNKALKLIVSFENEEDREEFSKKYPFDIMKKQGNAWSTWFPYKEREDRSKPHED